MTELFLGLLVIGVFAQVITNWHVQDRLNGQRYALDDLHRMYERKVRECEELRRQLQLIESELEASRPKLHITS